MLSPSTAEERAPRGSALTLSLLHLHWDYLKAKRLFTLGLFKYGCKFCPLLCVKNRMEKGTEVGKSSLKPSPFQFFIILFGPLSTLLTLPHHWLIIIIIRSHFVITSVQLPCKGREQRFPLTEEDSLQKPELAQGAGLAPSHSLQHHVQASGLEFLVSG